jgi:hypothetical protein
VDGCGVDGGGADGGGNGADGGGGGGNRGGNGCGRGGGRALVICSPLYLYFADMSSHVDIIHPTCPKWGNVITHKIR